MNYFVTGANRGIGLALTQELLQRGHSVWAGARQVEEASALKNLQPTYPDRLHPIQIDVTDDASIARCAESLKGEGVTIDTLINNAGVGTSQGSLEEVSREDFLRVLNINTVSPLLVAKALLPLMENSKAPKIFNISSILGSIASHDPSWALKNYPYNSSKTALNMVSRMMHFHLQAKNIAVFSVHPGWVKTDLGGEEAPLSPKDSARMIIDQCESRNTDSSGTYFDPEGNDLPW